PRGVGLTALGLDSRRREPLHERVELGAALDRESEMVEADTVLAEPIVACRPLEGRRDHKEGFPSLCCEQHTFGRGPLPDRRDLAGDGDLHELQSNHLLVEAPSHLRILAPKEYVVDPCDLHPAPPPESSAMAPSRKVRRMLASSIDRDKALISSRARAS